MASLRRIIFKAALAWLASMQTMGTPRSFNLFHSQTDRGTVANLCSEYVVKSGIFITVVFQRKGCNDFDGDGNKS